MAVLTAYIDESGTHGGSAYTVMTGLVGYAEEWAKFEDKWRELTELVHVPYIHGKELRPISEVGYGAFKNQNFWPKKRRILLAATAVNLAKEHFLFGMT